MKPTGNDVLSEAKVSSKKPYSKPKLIVYGKLREYTAGGSGPGKESGKHGEKVRP